MVTFVSWRTVITRTSGNSTPHSPMSSCFPCIKFLYVIFRQMNCFTSQSTSKSNNTQCKFAVLCATCSHFSEFILPIFFRIQLRHSALSSSNHNNSSAGSQPPPPTPTDKSNTFSPWNLERCLPSQIHLYLYWLCTYLSHIHS